MEPAPTVRTATNLPPPIPGCPLTDALSAIGGKWNLICLYWLDSSKRRFSELRRLMPEVSQSKRIRHQGSRCSSLTYLRLKLPDPESQRAIQDTADFVEQQTRA
jgi:hypothetical protein